MQINFYAIGHVTNDLEPPPPHPGGGATYTALAVKLLGLSANIITECPPNHPYIKVLEKLGINVYRLPTVVPDLEKTITSFKNFYDEKGRRYQVLTQRQDDINLLDLKNFPQFPENSVILAAPVIAEVNPELFPILAQKGELMVTPQGYFRKVEKGGKIKRVPWKNLDALASAKVTILSDEDISFDSRVDQETLEKIRQLCPIVVLTQGPQGLTVFDRDENAEFHILPFALKDEEKRDFTGAGDCTAGAFINHFVKTRNPKESGAFAAFYAALKIYGLGGEGIGIRTIPTIEQVHNFILKESNRFNSFLEQNGLTSLSLLPEGNHIHFKEKG